MRRDGRRSGSGAINRRALFRFGAAGGVLVAVEQAIGRAAPPSAPEARPEPFDLEEATIADLQKRMVVGEDTARSLVEKYAARIEALDKRGPALRAVLEVNPDALKIAEDLEQFAAEELRSFLRTHEKAQFLL